jgi:hypothetical protein
MFDGSPVICEFFGTLTTPSTTAASLNLCLFEGATEITLLGGSFIGSSSGTNQLETTLSFKYRFTPTAGLHTYTVTAFTSATTGTPAIAASAASSGTFPPAFIRFTKV